MFIKGILGGIYKITCLPTGKIYVGSSINIRSRWESHIGELKRNKHRNLYLQRAWNKYGKENFKFEIIEIVNPNLLMERELYWFKNSNCCNPKIGFNIGTYPERPMLGRNHSKKTKLKMSMSGKRKIFTKEHKLNISLSSKGKKKSKTHIENNRKAQIGLHLGSKNSAAILTENIVKEIRSDYEKYKQTNKNKYKESIFKRLIEKYHLTQSYLEKIVYRQIWKHI